MEEPVQNRYVMSLRWALSQFAGGMDEVVPVNLLEHFYASLVFFLTFWSGAIFISTLTSHMTQFFFLSREQSNKINDLMRYLKQYSITQVLSLRVLRNARAAMRSRRQQMPESSAGIEELVSLALRTELHFEMYSPYIKPHPFFSEFIKDNAHVARRVCHFSMSVCFNSTHDVVFHFGEEADHMIFINRGTVKYVWGTGHQKMLSEGGWLSEAVLWTHWTHQGVLTSEDDSRCFNLSAASFQEVVNKFALTNFDPEEYAAAFVESLRSKPLEEVNDLADEDAERAVEAGRTSWQKNKFRSVLPDSKSSQGKVLNVNSVDID
jgi:hypothetical protein